jgi:SAM-dependent methyltransferase
MTESTSEADKVRKIYAARFDRSRIYRNKVWQVLTKHFFQHFVPENGAVLDLGCGYGEFINNIRAKKKHAIDLNPDAQKFLAEDVSLHLQLADDPWNLPNESLDVVFTSNFFEHLRTKEQLAAIFQQTLRCLKPGGRIICLGPNIAALKGNYWDFWDHFLPLTDKSLSEGLEVNGFQVERSIEKFLPYTLLGGPCYPLIFVRIYIQLPLAWKIFGKQFLVLGQKPKR